MRRTCVGYDFSEYVHNITANKKRPSTLLLPSKRTEFEQISLLKNASEEWLDKSIWEEGNGIEIK